MELSSEPKKIKYHFEAQKAGGSRPNIQHSSMCFVHNSPIRRKLDGSQTEFRASSNQIEL